MDLKSLVDEVFDTNEARSPIEEASSKSGSSAFILFFSVKKIKVISRVLNRESVVGYVIQATYM